MNASLRLGSCLRFLTLALAVVGHALLKEKAWKQYGIVWQGDHFQTWVNGVKVTDLRDGMTKTGFIGLQVHGVGDRTDPLVVRWCNLRVKALN